MGVAVGVAVGSGVGEGVAVGGGVAVATKGSEAPQAPSKLASKRSRGTKSRMGGLLRMDSSQKN